MTRIDNPAYTRFKQDYDLIEHCLEGQRAIHENAILYLPQPPAMSAREYDAYAKRGTYLPVAERTLRDMCGLALRTAPNIALPQRLEPMRLNATYRGHPLNVFIEEAMRQVLSKGRYLALLDFPVEGASSTDAPWISTFNAENIRDHRYNLVNGREVATFLRLCEDNEALDDGIEQHLVLTLEPVHGAPETEIEFAENVREGLIYRVRRFHVKGKDEWMVGDEITPRVNGQYLHEIPFACISPYNLSLDYEKAPLLDLCNLSLTYYRNSCDYENILHLATNPLLVRKGAREDEKNNTIGSGVVWDIGENGDVKYVESDGGSAAAMRIAMQDKREDLAALGAKFITESLVRNESQQTAVMRYRSENALLHSTVEMLEQALTKLLRIAADWTRPGSSSEVVVEFNRDFIAATIDPRMVEVLLKAWQAGAMSMDTLLWNLRKGELIDPERSTEDEKDLIEEEGGGLQDLLPPLRTV